MVGIADVNPADGDIRALNLGVAAETKVGVVHHEHFQIDGTVRIVADGTTLTKRFMLKNERPGLVLMTLGATFILSGHGEATGRFENVAAMGIMAVNAVHVALNHGVMLGEIEFGLNIQMTLETGFGIFTGVNDKLGGATGTNVLAAGAMTGFTPALAGHGHVGKMQPRMGTGRKFTDDRGVTIGTSPVTDKMGTGNFQRRRHLCGGGGAGNQEKRQTGGKPQKKEHAECPLVFQRLRVCARATLLTAAPLMISAAIWLERSPLVGKTIWRWPAASMISVRKLWLMVPSVFCIVTPQPQANSRILSTGPVKKLQCAGSY